MSSRGIRYDILEHERGSILYRLGELVSDFYQSLRFAFVSFRDSADSSRKKLGEIEDE